MSNVNEATAGPTCLRTRYENDRFAGPFPLGTAGQMSFVGLSLTRSVFTRPGPTTNDPYVNRHLDSPMVAHCARTRPYAPRSNRCWARTGWFGARSSFPKTRTAKT